ncbi:MAG: response regulator [Candidatus Limnocylindria bacterium]
MPAQQIRLMVVEDVPQVASHIRSLLQSQSQIKMLEVVTSGDQALSSVTEVKPDVVIVDALLQGRVRGADVAQQIRQAEPQVGLIMLTVPQNPVAEDPDRGVDAVLKMPFSGFDLTTLVRKVGEARAQETAGSGCLMISMFSPKGGVGRTTLAYNIAVALGQQHRVCVVDGSLQFSDMRGLISVPPSAPSLLDLPTDRIREQDLADVVWRDPSGIDMLLAPPRVEMAEMVTSTDIEKALSLLRQLYDFVIIDTRASLTDDVLTFLDQADLILQVLTFEMMAIRAVAMAGETFEAIGYPASKIVTILNRSDASASFDKAYIEEIIRSPIHYEVVSDGRMVLSANNEGRAFVMSDPDSPVAQGVRRIADGMAALHRDRAAVPVGVRR